MVKNKIKVLVTGINSLVGCYLWNILQKDFGLIGTYHTSKPLFTGSDRIYRLDINNKQDIKRLIQKIQPHTVIHLASLSSIDDCEKNPDLAEKINVYGTRNLVNALVGKKVHLIFFSSNAVFAGTHPPYTESAFPHPLNVYGQTKFQAEKLIQNTLTNWTIVRSTTIYGWNPPGTRVNDVTYYLPRLQNAETLYLVNDHYFNPIYALEVTKAVSNIIQSDFRGFIHIAGKTQVTRYTFVQKIIEEFHINNPPPVVAVKSNFFPKTAPRPKMARLDTIKMQHVLKQAPLSLESGLSLMRAEKDI